MHDRPTDEVTLGATDSSTDRSTAAWTAELGGRLDVVTLRSELTVSDADRIVELVRQFGFAIVESTACTLDDAAIRDRADRLELFGAALGTPVAQSLRRELVEDVKDYSDVDASDDRGYRSGGELTPHSDPPTLILLHCVQPARTGGESSLVSVAAIVERMTARDPELTDALFEPFPAWRVAGQYGDAEAGPAAEPLPVLTRHDGVLSCVLYRPFIELAAAATGVPLTARQVAALDLFEDVSTSAELALRFTLRPGQTLVLHNRAVLHARTDYSDWPELHRRRHLLRMWIDAPDRFPVHPVHELGDFFAPAASVAPVVPGR